MSERGINKGWTHSGKRPDVVVERADEAVLQLVGTADTAKYLDGVSGAC